MATEQDIVDVVKRGYAFDVPCVELGALVVDGRPQPDAGVRVPLAMMNRHGLIAGATGTGKTVTLQVIAEQLADHGVPVFAADVKGDLTGLARRAKLVPRSTLGRRASARPESPPDTPWSCCA